MQGEPDAGARGPGSLTPPLKPGPFRLSPRTFLIRSPNPLAHTPPGKGLAEPRALLQGLEGGKRDPCPASTQGQNTALTSSLKEGPKGFDFTIPSYVILKA